MFVASEECSFSEKPYNPFSKKMDSHFRGNDRWEFNNVWSGDRKKCLDF